MPDTDESTYRRHYRAESDDVTVREPDEVDSEDEVFEIRMPIATTGQVRNDSDDPLTRAELSGMARQLNERQIGVFPAHGNDDMIAFGKYSPFERLGDWREAELQTREDSDMLMATARMPDPETLPAATKDYRTALAIIKEQAKRGIAQDASIGWRDDDDFDGGVDLMEASIVGIGADWRTNTGNENAETTASVVARAAVDAGADPDALVDAVRSAVDGERPLGPPGDEDRFESFDECVQALMDDPDVSREDAEEICGAWEAAKQSADTRADYEVGDETVEITPPDYMVNAAALAMQKSDDGLGSDCGTGVGDERADQIRADEVGPDVVTEIAAYLTSHAEDVTADGTPDEWSDDEWDDCGNMQYAKWGGLGTGTALDWAQARANAVADARDEDLPYPDRSTNDMSNTDTPDDPDEQDADDGETTDRAPEDVTENDLLTFTAMHFDGMDEEDLAQAVDAADASYIGECDAEALFDFVSIVTGAEYGEVEDAMGDLMTGDGEDTDDEQGDYGDDEDEEDEDDEDEQSADTEQDADDSDSDRDADTELRDEVEALREELDEIRDGGLTSDDVETPDDNQDADPDEEQDADETDSDEQTAESPTAGLGDYR